MGSIGDCSITPRPSCSLRARNANSSTNTTGSPASNSPGAIFEWIEGGHNPTRRHSSIRMLTAQYEAQHITDTEIAA
jgi:hypothetical protein